MKRLTISYYEYEDADDAIDKLIALSNKHHYVKRVESDDFEGGIVFVSCKEKFTQREANKEVKEYMEGEDMLGTNDISCRKCGKIITKKEADLHNDEMCGTCYAERN